MATYIVAVSGGVDSVVLLDMLVKQPETGDRLVVAHFDHGIRPSSADDARFVAELARQHGLEFVTGREELGSEASEALARDRRYRFLEQVAREHQGRIATAHHADDVIGTIAINLRRGTQWRGLAPFVTGDIWRPLLNRTKNELYDYLVRHRLEYVEDETNSSDKYLRNRINKKLTTLPPEYKSQLLSRWDQQCQLRSEIEQVLREIVAGQPGSRQIFRELPANVARELLREYIYQQIGSRPIWPAIDRALEAVRRARGGSEHQLGDKVSLWIEGETIAVRPTQPMLQ